MRVRVLTDVQLHSSLHAKTYRVSMTRSSRTFLRSNVLFHSRLFGVFDLVVVSGAVLEKQRVADVERSQRHVLRSWMQDRTKLAPSTCRASGKPSSSDGQASGIPNFRFHFVVYLGAMDADTGRETEEASRSESLILTGPIRHEEAALSQHSSASCLLSCAGGAMEFMEHVPDSEG